MWGREGVRSTAKERIRCPLRTAILTSLGQPGPKPFEFEAAAEPLRGAERQDRPRRPRRHRRERPTAANRLAQRAIRTKVPERASQIETPASRRRSARAGGWGVEAWVSGRQAAGIQVGVVQANANSGLRFEASKLLPQLSQLRGNAPIAQTSLGKFLERLIERILLLVSRILVNNQAQPPSPWRYIRSKLPFSSFPSMVIPLVTLISFG